MEQLAGKAAFGWMVVTGLAVPAFGAGSQCNRHRHFSSAVEVDAPSAGEVDPVQQSTEEVTNMGLIGKISMLAMACLLVGAMNLGCAQQSPKVKRYGSVIGIKKENIPEYKRLHADTWPGVLKKIKDCHIQNYSIYLAEVKPDEYYLFSYFEYTGDDLDKEIEEKMKNDPTTKKWWSHTDPLQFKVPTAGENEWWHNLEEVFHTD